VSDGTGVVQCTLQLGASNQGCENLVRPSSSAGTERWTASYGTGEAAFPVTFIAQTPTVTASPSTATPAWGTPFTVNAQVLLHGTHSPVASGSAQLEIDGQPSGAPIALDANGAAQFPVTLSSLGAHTLQVDYLGAARKYASVNSKTVTVQVGAVPVQITAASSSNPAAIDQAVTLTAMITVPSGSPHASCVVLFLQDGNLLGVGPVGTNWKASLPNISWAAAGTYPIDVQFSCGPSFQDPNTQLNQVVVADPGSSPAPAVSITSRPPPNGVWRRHYTFTMTATGTAAPSFWLARGAPPPGLRLRGRTGVITGTPGKVGRFSFTIRAGRRKGPQATARYTIRIAKPGRHAKPLRWRCYEPARIFRVTVR
jgi:Bacterial Ig-like domain (group 3)/Putative Ig domain